MSNPNYTLEIVSHHSKFDNKTLRKYYVDGIETVGAWGDEPFEIRFKNHTWQKLQVKISLDGTDILTGQPADTQVSKDMWVVNGYGTLSLKAWPETSNGGAQFVFTSADKSVAVHTHGDLTSRGIIAAAVFTEGHVEPIKLAPVEHHHHHHHWDYYWHSPVYGSGNFDITCSPTWVQTNNSNASGVINNVSHSKGINSRRSRSNTLGGTISGASSSTISSVNSRGLDSATFDCLNINESDTSADLGELVSVGAGEHVDQKITYVTGLIKPTFSETVRVKYLWWDDLVAKLRTETAAKPQPSGFPGDHNKKNIDLKGTPRIGEKRGSFHRVAQEQVFDRF